MALLRDCLQELRVKQGEWHGLPGGWPPSKPACSPDRFHRIGAVPLRPAAPAAQPLRPA
jgi:hypothetical protein